MEQIEYSFLFLLLIIYKYIANDEFNYSTIYYFFLVYLFEWNKLFWKSIFLHIFLVGIIVLLCNSGLKLHM